MKPFLFNLCFCLLVFSVLIEVQSGNTKEVEASLPGGMQAKKLLYGYLNAAGLNFELKLLFTGFAEAKSD